MSNLSDFLGSSKPRLITSYTTGTGTYIPTADLARCFIRIQAGGSGGYTSGTGGGGGAMIELWYRIPIAGIAYIVGAGGAVTAAGSLSSFGPFIATPGFAPVGASIPGNGGMVGQGAGATDAASKVHINIGGTLNGVSGGAGGYTATYHGLTVGYPIAPNESYAMNGMINRAQGNGQGLGSGGDSFYGKGGVPGSSPAATAYGAGGGSNAAGRGGYIEIWDYGA